MKYLLYSSTFYVSFFSTFEKLELDGASQDTPEREERRFIKPRNN